MRSLHFCEQPLEKSTIKMYHSNLEGQKHTSQSFDHKISVFDFRKLKFSRFIAKILLIKSNLLNWHETVFYLLNNNICPWLIPPLDFETPGAELCT